MPTPLEVFRTHGSQAVQGSPHAKALGLEFVAVDPGWAKLKAPYRPEIVGDPDTGVIAGGVVTALLDVFVGRFRLDKVIERRLRAIREWLTTTREQFVETMHEVVRHWRLDGTNPR